MLRLIEVIALVVLATVWTAVPRLASAQEAKACTRCALPATADSMLPPGKGAIIGVVIDTGHGAPGSWGAVRLVPAGVAPTREHRVQDARFTPAGGFVLLGLEPGLYDLRADGNGFTNVMVRSISVRAGAIDTLTIRVTDGFWPNSPQ
jgi:hypothetical protein